MTARAPTTGETVLVVRATSSQQLAEISSVVASVVGYTDIHPAVLRSVLGTGGYVAGAYSESGQCVGALYGLVGARQGKLFLHSEMLAVLPEFRSSHVATTLKLDQRTFALEQGIDVVTWTFDPLRGVNANLNIRTLGCDIVGYERDMYGRLPGFSSGWPTDQLLLEWRVRSARVANAVAGVEPRYPIDRMPNVVDTKARSDGLLEFKRFVAQDAEGVLVEIPESIQTIRESDMDAVLDWRYGIREAFEYYLSRRYEVAWFHSALDERRRNFYILKKAR